MERLCCVVLILLLSTRWSTTGAGAAGITSEDATCVHDISDTQVCIYLCQYTDYMALVREIVIIEKLRKLKL